jgi:hypothetical protein
MRRYTAKELRALPTRLSCGQIDDLKVEDTDEFGPYRVWLEHGYKVSHERLINGAWVIVMEYLG